MSRARTQAQRAQRGFGVARQRAHREASVEPRRPRQAPLLSRAERAHLAGMVQRRALQDRLDARAARERREAERAAEAAAGSTAAGVGEGEREAATDGTVEASPPTPAPPTPPPPDGAGARRRAGGAWTGRDPRLGAYLNVGTFLHHCWRRFGMGRAEVYAVAGLASAAPAEWLLEYRGGLPALFRACEARQKAGVG